ncbi:Uncharacterized protein BWINRA5_03011 [Bacillus mycoides]|nr:hypothetical protein [Bacillus mycoides]KZD36435.1 hypothetical protein B4083_3184 [Bacillus cereus]MDM5427909.1 hypothetical protein [Bacillus mycoides]SCA99599.1 Uncharacterized protein BWINRA5_03011 [Bacillus mycoides]
MENSEKRIQTLEGKIVNLEKVINTLEYRLEIVKSKTQLEK